MSRLFLPEYPWQKRTKIAIQYFFMLQIWNLNKIPHILQTTLSNAFS